ncbi:MAG: hypothetical protein HOW73_12535 [Polyangiaceae bacterium]|nr:hypothetical protein [Polyangiaceae bacterium]
MQAEALKVNDKAEFISVKAIGFDAKGHVDIERENGVRAVFEWRYSDPSKRLGEDIVEGSVTLVTSQKCAPVKAPCIVITPGRSVMVLNRQRGRRLPECTLADAWAAAREKLGLPQDTIANAVAGSTPELWHIAVEGHNELAVSIDDKTCVYVPPNEAIRREDAYRKP